MTDRLLRYAALVLAFSAPAVAQEQLSPELLWELGRVSSPAPSPDGTKLLYNVRRYELAENSGQSHVFVLDLATGEHRQLTHAGSNFGAQWSKDGKAIAFVSTRSGSAQIHLMPMSAAGEARQVTTHPGGVSNVAWSPDNRWFSFTAHVKLDPDVQDLYPDLPHAEARVYDDLMVRHWDEWKDGTYSHLFVVSADGGDARDLMEGQRVDTPLKPFGGGEHIAWSHDSETIAYVAKRVSNPESSTNSDVFVVPAAGGAHVNVTDGMPGYEINPSFSPKGGLLAFESMARNGYESDQNRLFVLDLESGEKRRVEDWDLSVAEYAWAPSGDRFYLAADQRGTHQIFTVPLAGGEPTAVTEGRWHFGSIQPSPNGSTLFATRMHTERPNEIVAVELGEPNGGRPLTHVNDAMFEKLALPKVEERWFDATDGGKIHSWVIYPPNFDPKKKWPMLTYCQGGPQSQVGQWFSFRWNFHLMAAQGYVVLGINRRGLPGFGTEWNEQISRDWGGQAMRDLLSATDAMFEEDFIDRERTAAIGASFGGYTTYWLMGHDQEDRFCAMIAHCGVFNLESMYLSTEELFFVNWDLGGPFWKDRDVAADYRRFSPHRFIQEWDTPLMVIHGQKDFRVPLEQGLQAFTAAQLQNCPSRFVYFPTESHWVLSPQNGVLWHRLFFDWLDRWCKQ